MALTINTNLAAISAYNNLNATNQAMNTSLERLSSGLKVRTAADDASGYVISQYLQQQINGTGQAIQNAQDAVSVLQTAEGALNQSVSILQQMNTLATQAANGGASNTNSQAADQQTFAALQSELDQIANSTQYGTTQLLNGSYTGQVFQIGAYNSTFEQVSVSINNMSSTSLGVGVGQANISSTSAAQNAMNLVQAAIQTVASQQATLGADQNRVQAIVANLTVGQQNLQAANSRIVDTNMAQEMTSFTTDQVLMQAGTAMLAQAQHSPDLVLKLLG